MTNAAFEDAFEAHAPAAAVRVAAVTDVGPTRQRNEDAVLVPGVILAAMPHGHWEGQVASGATAVVQVIDGMGAHGGGSLASALSALMMNELASAGVAGADPDPAWLEHSLQAVGDTVVDVGTLNPGTRIMGAATAGLVIGGVNVLAYNVGDCRVYVAEGGYLSLLTTDHRSRVGGGLTRSLGGTGKREVVTPDVIAMDRLVPRRYLLCSDGLTDTLPFDVLRDHLQETSAPEAATRLVEAAIEANSQDNVTVIVVDVGAV